MIDISRFCQLVDQVPITVLSADTDVASLYDYYGLNRSNFMSTTIVYTHLKDRIKNCFSSDTKDILDTCARLERELISLEVFEGKSIDRYFAVCNRIREIARELPNIRPDIDDWGEAIKAACELTTLQHIETPKANFRDYALIKAMKNLRKSGFHAELKEGKPFLANADWDRLVGRINEIAKEIGGVNIANQMFGYLGYCFNKTQRRYHLVRKLNSYGNSVEPEVPWGYLFHLAGKYPSYNPCFNNPSKLWSELISLSTNFAALYEVQPYNQFELMFRDSSNIIKFIQELALYDHLFSIQQMRSTDVIRILHGILADLDWQLERKPGWSIAEALEIGSAVLEIAGDKNGPVRFSASKLRRLCPSITSAGRMKQILKKIFSHSPMGANLNYTLPTDMPGPDLMFRPLFTDGNDEYWLLDAAPCSYAVFESIYSAARASEEGNHFDDKLGPVVERFLRQELTSRGVTWETGEYEVGTGGECDIVVETTECVIFIEVKKKALTRLSRSGSDVKILIDISESLLDSQLQAGKSELLLRQQGFISLKDKASGRISKIALGERGVERISITLLDYGSFQDRTVLKQFLEACLQADFTSSDRAFKNKFDKLSLKLHGLRSQVNELAKYRLDGDYQPFFHCAFISVTQFLVILDDVHSNKDLKDALWKTRHTSTGSLDFYFDYDYITRTSKLNPVE